MNFRKAIAILLLGLAAGQSFASVCATCNALPNARQAAAGATGLVQTEQRLAAAASDCEFQAVCSVAGASVAPARDVDARIQAMETQPRAIARLWSTRTIKPPLHPPKTAA